MAAQWPVDKLTCINRALTLCGDNLVSVPDDGSDEWNVASPAYEGALAAMLEDHGWVQATKVTAALAASPTAPTDHQYDTAYNLPADCLHLIWVRLDDIPVPYDILAGQIVLNARGGPPPPVTVVVPGVVSIKYVSLDNSEPTSASPLFVEALIRFIRAGIYSGLHEDLASAQALQQEAMQLLQRAKTRSDQQKPKRAFFNSHITARRRVRSPWPPIPSGWGGTGVPN